MSLVVTMIDQGRLQICADLRIVRSDILPSGVNSHSPNYFNGVLKVIPISTSVAICYAGTVSIALEAIRTAKDSDCRSSTVPSLLINKLMEGNNLNACDFLVVDAEELTVRKVHEGTITLIDDGFAWVGDSSAYNSFQNELDELGISVNENPISKAAKMMKALQAVIDNRSILNVGEFPLTAHSFSGEIQLGIAFAAQGPRVPTIEGNTPVQFSNDTNTDSLVINLTVPVERGIAAIGVYISQAHRGALYVPLKQDEPYLVDGFTVGEFRRKVQEEYCIELLGGGFE